MTLRRLPWHDPLNLPAYPPEFKVLNTDSLEKRRKIQSMMFVTNNNNCPCMTAFHCYMTDFTKLLLNIMNRCCSYFAHSLWLMISLISRQHLCASLSVVTNELFVCFVKFFFILAHSTIHYNQMINKGK